MGYEIPYADEVTESLDLHIRTWEDLMADRKRFTERSLDRVTGEVRSEFLMELADIIERSEKSVQGRIAAMIREHPMADWLAEAKTSGVRVGTILTTIKNPHRFPSQMCSEGCHLLPTFSPGEPCPCETTPEKGGNPEACEGVIQEKRPGTGCRALWKMLGLYPVKNKKGEDVLARHMKSRGQSSHSTRAKTAIMMPQGIAQQFYMQGSRYAEVYYREKERLAERSPEKAKGWIDATARVIAAKAWAGDLLVEWKERVPLGEFVDGTSVSEYEVGEPVAALAAV